MNGVHINTDSWFAHYTLHTKMQFSICYYYGGEATALTNLTLLQATLSSVTPCHLTQCLIYRLSSNNNLDPDSTTAL